MSGRTYTFAAERDPESDWLVAEIVELPGCYTQAPDLGALEANVREAITAYLRTDQDEDPKPEGSTAW